MEQLEAIIANPAVWVALITAVIGGYFVARVNNAGKREIALIDELQEERSEMKKDISDIKTDMALLKAENKEMKIENRDMRSENNQMAVRMEVKRLYIETLRKHIDDQLSPPPPEYPSELLQPYSKVV